MKTASGNMVSHLQDTSTRLATCWKVKRTDGTLQGFTDHDLDLDIDLSDGDGEISYKASTGYNRTAVQTSNNLRVDELEVVGVLDSSAIEAQDLRAGKYDKAEIKVFMVRWDSLGDGIIRLRRGWIGEVNWVESQFRAELRGIMQAYTQEIVELATPDCRADFGDTRCKIQLSPVDWFAGMETDARLTRDGKAPDAVSPTQYNICKPTTQNGLYAECTVAGIAGGSEPSWPSLGNTVNDGSTTWQMIRAYQQEGTVSSVTSQKEVVATGVSEPSGASPTEQWWGLLEWLTGDNQGIQQEVKDDDGAGTLSLFLPAPYTIQTGDTFRVTALCRKTLAACRDTFRNTYNFRGEPHVPGNDTVFNYPDAR